jgi:hypothetical protein
MSLAAAPYRRRSNGGRLRMLLDGNGQQPNYLNEFLATQAAVQRLSMHQHRLEGARISPSDTRSAEDARHILDKRTLPTVGFCPFACDTMVSQEL